MSTSSPLAHHGTRITQYAIRYSPLASLILLAIFPLLPSNYPTIGDGLNHFYRLAELERHIAQGDLYPRWLATLHYGYGSPLFNFYSSLSYYIALIFRIAFPLATSLQLGYIFALIVAIIGAYTWARDQFDSDVAGLACAAAYAFAPYLYFDIFHRGAYPETWGLALAPWVMRSALRVTFNSSRLDSLAFALLYAALILTHTITAFILTPILLVYIFTLLFTRNHESVIPSAARNLLGNPRDSSSHPSTTREKHRAPLRTLLGMTLHPFGIWILGFGISCFFVLPIIFESQFIQLNRTINIIDLDYRNNFLTLSTLFSLPPNFDPNLVANFMPASLSLAQLVLVIGNWLLVISLARRNLQSLIPNLPLFIVHFSLFILLCFLTLSISQPIWSIFPFAQFIQFPWRLVGIASLLLAMLFAASISQLEKINHNVARLSFVIGIFSFFISSLSWTYHARYESLPNIITPNDTTRFEIIHEQPGATSNGEYLPIWVGELPKAKIEYDKCKFSTIKLNEDEVKCDSSQEFVLTINRFYFPAWAATLDGKSIEIMPSSPNGLITLQIPSGQHTIKVFLQPTLPQVAGAILSIIALALLIVYSNTQYAIRYTHQSPISNPQSPITSLFIASLFIVHFFSPFRSSPPIPNPVSVNFENQLELIGFESPATFVSGEPLDLKLYWRAMEKLDKNYSTTVQLADKFGNRYGASDSQHPNQTPTSRWSPDQYARDSHHLVSLLGTPPGDYRLLVGVHENGKPLSVIENNAPIGIEYEISKVSVTRAKPQPSGAMKIIDVKLANDKVESGDQLAFTLLINSGDKTIQGLTASLFLVDTKNRPALNEPLSFTYPPEQWTLNELIRQPFSVNLPPDPAAAHQVGITVRDGERNIITEYAIGLITLTVPQRTFTIPQIPRITPSGHDFKDSIRLLGYDIQNDSITLYWQSLKPVTKRLTIFVHRLDSNGAFVAGNDLAPARATTSWINGEVITTVHPIRVGNTFEIGLYDPINGERFGQVFVVK